MSQDETKQPAAADAEQDGAAPGKGEQADAGTDADRDEEDEDDGKPALSGRARLVLLALALVVLIAGVVWYVRHESHGKYLQETNDARIAADAVIVAPKVGGYVTQVLVTDNEDVRTGQPLVRIDPRDYQAKAAQVEAQIAEADASADNGRAAIDEQYATIDQTRAQLAAARAKASHDAGEVARYAPLVRTGAETGEQLAKLRLAAQQSADDARAQAAALVMQQRHVAALRTQVRQGEAQARGARAQLQAANVDLSATLIRASVNGRIGDKTVTIGQYAQAGTRLMSVVPLDQLYVVANFKETQLALMRPGQPATIKVDALDGIELRGKVVSVSPGTGAEFSLLPPQNATGNFTKIVQRVPVRIAIQATPEARRLLVPGLSVTATVDTIAAKRELDRIREREEQAGNR